MSTPTPNGWSMYEKLVLDKLNTLDDRMSSIENGQVLVRIDVANLKIKAGLWGGMAGLIPSLIAASLVILGGK